MNPKLDELLISPRTLSEALLFLKKPSHALIISGLPGSGKTAVSKALVAAVLGVQNLENYPYFTVIRRPEGKKDIPIEDIRTVLRSLRLKTTGRGNIRRIIFIEDAHHLSTEAQNALLKALEEPAGDTVFILSVPSGRAVLPTIASRAARLSLSPVSLQQASDYYSAKYQPNVISSAWQLSQGRSGLLSALLNEEAEHPLKQAVEAAKRLLGQNSYERLLELDKTSKDKEQFGLLLEALDKVLGALERARIGRGQSPRELLKSRRLVAKLQSALSANASPRLIALELALNLKT